MLQLTQKKGVTLTELLISTMLIGMVMMGVVSVDYATKQSQIRTTRKSLIAAQVGGMMADITKNLTLATGNASNPSTTTGVRANTMSGDWGTSTDLCIRRDVNMAGAELNTPTNLGDDSWVCYTIGNGGNANRLFTCIKNSPSACNPSDTYIGKIISLTTTRIGTGTYFEVNIQSRYDPSQAANPFENPDFNLKTRVQAALHSWRLTP